MPAATRATPPEKLDLYKRHKADYAAPKKPVILDVAPARYLSIAGAGSPDDRAFHDAMEGLYGMAYTLKFASKHNGRDFVVCKLEGLWSGWNTGKPPAQQDKSDWKWRLLIRVPDFITEAARAAAVETLIAKGKNPACREVELVTLDEGRCVQMLHVGPYDREMDTIDAMHAHAASEGLRPHGKHHEIYLSDPRRVAPQKLRTILRHPVR